MADKKVKWKSKVSNIIQKKNALEVFKVSSEKEELDSDEDEDEYGDGDKIVRRFCFESKEERKLKKNRGKGNLAMCNMNVEVNINDIAEKDDDDIADSVANMVHAVLNSVYFKGMMKSYSNNER